VHYLLAQGGYQRELFAGTVQSVSLHEDRVVLECEGAANLTERVSGGTVASGLTQAELVRSLLLVAGLSADAISLEAPAPEQPQEKFEVLLPIRGVSVKEHSRSAAWRQCRSHVPKQRSTASSARAKSPPGSELHSCLGSSALSSGPSCQRFGCCCRSLRS
jgi:hypothetical protein